MFKSFLGRSIPTLFFILLWVPQSAQAIFIRGNGGFAVQTQGLWFAQDVFEQQSKIEVLPRYSKAELLHAKITEYIFRLRYPVVAMDIYTSIQFGDCTASDFTQAETSYTFHETMRVLREAQAQNKITDFKLAAINFFDPARNSYRICTTPAFYPLSIEQRAVLIFHEIAYIYLELEKQNPPTAEDVRRLVAQILFK
ncbi:hypothetical protein AZI87_16050 [Bdellovibrio bacteriovorus]|uniref:Uncharacterized protein n=2 Tax=Pseudobdellovibrionaceae TaxID=213483 RepID=A0A161QET0_BDEBC|nr:hypothetical protein AZI87_16050 [Bdellovibrio bacteriovorus]